HDHHPLPTRRSSDLELSIVTEHNAPVRHTLAEQHFLEKGQTSWKEEIREAIEYSRENATDFDSFKKHLSEEYGVEMKLRGKTLRDRKSTRLNSSHVA